MGGIRWRPAPPMNFTPQALRSVALCWKRSRLLLFDFVTLLLRVKHPNILQLVDVFETKKEYFLFLEL